MAYAPHKYSSALLTDAIAFAFPNHTDNKQNEHAIEASASAIVTYYRWHGYNSDYPLRRDVVAEWLYQLGWACSNSWDGEDHAWNYYVDMLALRINEATNYCIDWA